MSFYQDSNFRRDFGFYCEIIVNIAPDSSENYSREAGIKIATLPNIIVSKLAEIFPFRHSTRIFTTATPFSSKPYQDVGPPFELQKEIKRSDFQSELLILLLALPE